MFKNVFFEGNDQKEVMIIDTVGFDDPNKERNEKSIVEFITSLIIKCHAINIFGIAINGLGPLLLDETFLKPLFY